jgi:hypothetical protein
MQTIPPVLTRVFSALLAIALVAVGTVVLVEVCAAWFGAGWTVLPKDTVTRLEHWQWNDRPVVTTIAAVGAVGLVAILVGTWRRAPLTVPMDGEHDVTFERRALEQSLRRHVEAIDGVNRARVVAKRDRIVARVETDRRFQPIELKERVDVTILEVAERQHLLLSRRIRLRFQGGEV